MKKYCAHFLALMLMALMLLSPASAEGIQTLYAADYPVTEDGEYLLMEEVAVYLATYDHLPGNFLTKKEAQQRGWDSRAGNLDRVAPGCAIGGDRFGNYEGILPEASNRKWTECDVNYSGGYRAGERLVFSNDGLIYYTCDHYATFLQIEVSFEQEETEQADAGDMVRNGWYTDWLDVTEYLHAYGELPQNYLTRTRARKLGWTPEDDNLGQVAPGCAIGGSVYENKNGELPQEKGRVWYECDVNTVDGHRGNERLVYSSDGLIFYTDDYESFIQLY